MFAASTSLNLAVMIRVAMAAARSAPRSEPANKDLIAFEAAVETFLLLAPISCFLGSSLLVALSRLKQGFDSPRERHVKLRHLKSFSFLL